VWRRPVGGQRGTHGYHAEWRTRMRPPAPRVLSVREVSAILTAPRARRRRRAVPSRAADVIPATRRLPGRAGPAGRSASSRFI
jgi:hypothetical protein